MVCYNDSWVHVCVFKLKRHEYTHIQCTKLKNVYENSDSLTWTFVSMHKPGKIQILSIGKIRTKDKNDDKRGKHTNIPYPKRIWNDHCIAF